MKAQAVVDVRPKGRLANDLAGLCLFFMGAASLLWLAWPQQALVPAAASHVLRLAAGSGAFLVPLAVLCLGSMFLVGRQRLALSQSALGLALLFLAFVTWRHLAAPAPPLAPPAPFGAPASMPSDSAPSPAWSAGHVMQAGGYLGAALGELLLRLLGVQTAYLAIVLMACVAVVLLADRPVIELLRAMRRPTAAGLAAAQSTAGALRGRKDAREADAASLRRRGLPSDDDLLPAPMPRAELLPTPSRSSALAEVMASAAAEDRPQSAVVQEPPQPRRRSSRNMAPPEQVVFSALVPQDETGYTLPPMDLLQEVPPPPSRNVDAELAAKVHIIEETLQHFNVRANVVEIARGPTVTRYEIQLAPGIKVNKIVSLADNLAMSLSAIDVRLEAPIPGKAAIGVEVPNSVAALVTIRECLDTPEFWNAPGKLTFALGRTVEGALKYADLSRMPHLLIGGSTNSGKSICLNALIASLTYRATPREVRLIMIDPKRVELSLWDGIPHLLHPVVKDVKQAAGIFRAALQEMDRRYDKFSLMGTRNIEGYNARVATPEEKLPYIVIIVDELADLMMQQGPEVETSICRLAQLARATGIHLVIATQRPSVDVITGLIKANIPSRIAFSVSSGIDSRTILDLTGAERLVGRGDMLFLPVDSHRPIRVQGCFVSEEETNRLVEYLKAQERPHYTMTPVDSASFSGGLAGDTPSDSAIDELFEQAVRYVVAKGQASTSTLQRKFSIGYTRAARLVDMMEERGIVGPLDGSKPREVRMLRDEVDAMFLNENTHAFPQE